MKQKFSSFFKQVRYFKSKSYIEKINTSENSSGKKALLFFCTSTGFLLYNSERNSFTGERRLNILSHQNRENVARFLLKTTFSPKIMHPAIFREYGAKTNAEKLLDLLMDAFLQEKEIPGIHPGYEALEQISQRLIDSNSNLQLQKPIIHLSKEPRISAYSLAHHIVRNHPLLKLNLS